MSLQKFSGNNAGGIAKLWLAPLSVFKGTVYNNATGLFMLQNQLAEFTPVYVTPDKSGFKVEYKQHAFNVTIDAVVPKVAHQSLLAIDVFRTDPFVVVVKDNNGNLLLFGSEIDYFLMNTSAVSGADYADFNHLPISLDKQMIAAPQFVQDYEVPAEPELPPEPALTEFTISEARVNTYYAETSENIDGDLGLTLKPFYISSAAGLLFLYNLSDFTPSKLRCTLEVYMPQNVVIDRTPHLSLFTNRQDIASFYQSVPVPVTPGPLWQAVTLNITTEIISHWDFCIKLDAVPSYPAPLTVEDAVIKVRNVQFWAVP